MSCFLIVKVLEPNGMVFPSTHIYSDVEIRSSSSDLSDEFEILEQSAISQHLNFSDYSLSSRIATIVEANSAGDAISEAEIRFTEVLDLKSIESPISNLTVSKIGFIKDLSSGKLSELIDSSLQPSPSFLVNQGSVQQNGMVNFLLLQDSELSQRYTKSLHWSRNSRHENNKQLRILFNWFSIEALIKESEKDNIAPTIRWFLGFPNGVNCQHVSSEILGKLESDPEYAYWKKNIISVLEEIRIFRNSSIHSGFRVTDFSAEKINLYDKLMIYAVSRCQRAVSDALRSRISTVSEFKNYIPLLFEYNENLINDIHNNILFSLSQIRK